MDGGSGVGGRIEVSDLEACSLLGMKAESVAHSFMNTGITDSSKHVFKSLTLFHVIPATMKSSSSPRRSSLPINSCCSRASAEVTGVTVVAFSPTPATALCL